MRIITFALRIILSSLYNANFHQVYVKRYNTRLLQSTSVNYCEVNYNTVKNSAEKYQLSRFSSRELARKNMTLKYGAKGTTVI